MKTLNKKIVYGVGLAVVVVVVIVGAYFLTLANSVPNGELRTAAGTYDKVGTKDYFVWNEDGTGYSWRGGIKYEGTWKQNTTHVIANYAGAPPDLTYVIVKNGVMWRDVLYVKRLEGGD